MSATANAARRVEEMRREFDRGFTLPPGAVETVKEQLLAVRIGTQPFALRLAEIAGLYADKKITHVPGASSAMLGIAGFRGLIAPVYDIASLMERKSGQTPRWLVVAAAAPIAFAFDEFEGQLRVSRDAIKPQKSQGVAGTFARDFVQAENVLRPIIGLEWVIGAIKT